MPITWNCQSQGGWQPPPTLSLPPGVTLQAIDGETITGLTQSHSYFTRNGFTQAVSRGWDNPSFFPLSNWYGGFFGTPNPPSDAATYLSLGFNTAGPITANSDLTIPDNAGISTLVGWDATHQAFENSITQQIGIEYDEPSSQSDMVFAFGNVPNAVQDIRPWYVNFTHDQISNGDFGGTPMNTWLANAFTTPNSTTRHIDMTSVDMYWFGGSVQATVQNWGWQFYNQSTGASTLTADQMARGNHYGDVVDHLRGFQTTFPAPLWCIVELIDGLVGGTTHPINPTELNWAVWAALVHGARVITYFVGINNITDGLPNTIYSGQSTSIRAQVPATNALVTSLASVLTSPFAINYANIVTPSSGNYIFPTATLSLTDGVDLMAKWDGSKFYIFSTSRNSQTTTNSPCTYSVRDTGATQATILDGRGGSIALSGPSGGIRTFSDPFVNAWDVHIYRFD